MKYLRFRKTISGYNVTVRGNRIGTIADNRASGGTWEANLSGLKAMFPRLFIARNAIRNHLGGQTA